MGEMHTLFLSQTLLLGARSSFVPKLAKLGSIATIQMVTGATEVSEHIKNIVKLLTILVVPLDWE